MILERRSTLHAAIDDVWTRIASVEGINDELKPWMTMSIPRGATHLAIDTIPVGLPLGRAWLRLFGVIPFDYDLLTIVALDPGRGFHEKSTMLSMRRWEHERTLTRLDDGTTEVRDRITFETRAPISVLTPLLSRVVHALFGHRHRRLQRHFGASNMS